MVIKYTLENGMTVLLESIPGVVSVSAGLWVKTGSRDESAMEVGYAHFIEHMLFKGTKTRSAKEIARIVDRVGGQHNAATNREYTCYYINVVSDFLDMSVELLADMYFNSLFDKEEIDKEKNVIIEEIRMYEDTPDDLIHDIFMECMLSEHPLGHPILGTEDNINNVTRESLLKFFSTQYVNANCVFAIAGNFELDAARAVIERHLSKTIQSTERTGNRIVVNPSRVYRRHVPRELEQVHFCLGTDGLCRNDDDRFALYAMSTILGGSMSSRLFQNIRESEGLCYSIYSFHSSYSDAGIFGIYCGTSPESYERALELILRECGLMLKSGIGEEELNDAKTFMKGNLALSMESTEVRMSQLAKNEMIFERDFTFEEIVSSINAITLDDYNRVCAAIFKDAKLALVSIGKLQNPDKTIPVIGS
jgi:predicted Zn-dependent peptidase